MRAFRSCEIGQVIDNSSTIVSMFFHTSLLYIPIRPSGKELALGSRFSFIWYRKSPSPLTFSVELESYLGGYIISTYIYE